MSLLLYFTLPSPGKHVSKHVNSSVTMSLLLYFTLVVGSAHIDINLSDSEAVYGTTGSPGHRFNTINMSTVLSHCHFCYVLLVERSVDIDVNLSDSEVVYRSTT